MRGRILAAALAAAVLFAVAAERFVLTEDEVPAISEQSLTGYWRKITEESCSSRYPAKLEFRAGGVYDAPEGPETGAYWHGGDWMITEDGRIVIQAANDAMVPYHVVEISGAQLTLEDNDGCRFTYRRDSK
jgi:hypothetical protein